MGSMSNMSSFFDLEIRVRYCETDAMGFLHHSNYFNYFEMGRTEMFRSCGGNYREMEEAGYFLVVVRVKCNYHKPARYDDVLRLRTIMDTVSHVKLVHRYELYRGAELLTEAESVLACVDRSGQVQRIPQLMLDAMPDENS